MMGAKCHVCHKVTGVISRHGMCEECGISKVRDAWKQLREKKGPIYEKWARKRRRRDEAQTTLLIWL